VPAALAQKPLESISGHGIPDLAGDSDTKPYRGRHHGCRGLFSSEHEELQVPPGEPPPASLYRQELAPLAQAAVPGEPKSCPHTASRKPEALLLRDRDGQLPPALAAAAPKDLTASGGLHTLTKPMGSLAAFTMRLERALHGLPPTSNLVERRLLSDKGRMK